jgi:23S rRNA (adenine2030-N6)-methyltransferase
VRAVTAAPDYSHRFHAGNVGDVWKHCVLVAALRALLARPAPLRVIETHAGEGAYALGPTGEWQEGIGRLWNAPADAPLPAALRDYLTLVAEHGQRQRRYPGSPQLCRALLRPDDALILCELVDETRQRLQEHLGADPRVVLHGGDGLAALLSLAPSASETLVLIDPPYADKDEWQRVGTMLLAAARVAPAARVLLWYPIKSLTRPTALLKRVEDAGVPAAALELVATPLELRRNRLNGSGVLLVNPPSDAVEALGAAGPALGALCATRQRWLLRQVGWR